jgi:glycosyltransferase involved in cell wall biosynthesis
MNEAVNLPGFLDHVTALFDEVIIVVDQRSTDDSDQIAKRYGCKIIHDRGESGGIVFYNKNRGAKAASHDYVFILDADERVGDELLGEIRDLISGKLETSAKVFQTSFLNYEFGKLFDQCDQRHKPFVRLFRKGSFAYQIQGTAEGFGIQTGSISTNSFQRWLLRLPVVRSFVLQHDPNIHTFSGSLIHNSHPDISDFVRKIDFYSDREAKVLYKVNKSPSMITLVLKILTLPLKEFIYKYFIWRFYKEGLHGLIASSIYAFYHFLIYAKYYALVYQARHKKAISQIADKYHLDTLKIKTP